MSEKLQSPVIKKTKVLVVGQTPPPRHGQAIMIEKLVNARFETIKIVHLRMQFSRYTSEIGRFSWRKILHIFFLLIRGAKLLLFDHIDVLYFFPAGPMWSPVLRDMMLLPIWRMLAPRVIYHFRAGGISEFLETRASWFRAFAKMAYGRPDAAITLSILNPKDGEYFQSKRIYVVPNGLEDICHGTRKRKTDETVALLYVGILSEEKGIYVLADAFRKLRSKGYDVSLHMAGEFDSKNTKEKLLRRLHNDSVSERVHFHGLLTDERKWELFQSMDVMCFLSYYRAETFGNVVLEAMMCELPVVATRWRGIPDLVIDNYNGYLVPVRDVTTVVEKLELLVQDTALRHQLGKNGRARYLQEFTLEKHLQKIEAVILETVGS